MEVSEGLLWCALRALVHPRELCFLETSKQFVLLHSVCESVFPLVGLEEVNALLQPPIVGKTCDSCMSVKRRSLTVVRVELVSVGFVNQHEIQDIVLME